MNPTHIINLLYQQICADQLQTNVQEVVLIPSPQEFYDILNNGSIDNWHIVLDMMGFPDDDNEDCDLQRDWIYKSYHNILKDSFAKTEQDIKFDLYHHYEYLKDILDAYNSNDKELLDSYFKEALV